jgi:hypothetical protein
MFLSKTTFKKEHYGPPSYGIGVHATGTIAILDSNSRELLDATGW